MRIIVIKYLKTLKIKLEEESPKVKGVINHIDNVVRFLKIL